MANPLCDDKLDRLLERTQDSSSPHYNESMLVALIFWTRNTRKQRLPDRCVDWIERLLRNHPQTLVYQRLAAQILIHQHGESTVDRIGKILVAKANAWALSDTDIRAALQLYVTASGKDWNERDDLYKTIVKGWMIQQPTQTLDHEAWEALSMAMDQITTQDPIDWPTILVRHAVERRDTVLAAYWEPLFRYTETDCTEKAKWFGVLLQSIHPPTVVDYFKRQGDARKHWNDMMMSAVSGNSLALREQAWNGFFELSELGGMEWLRYSGDLTPIGSASRWCALLRIMSGEVRIQYSLAIEGKESLVLLTTFSNICRATVAYLSFVGGDERDHGISPEAVLHVRDSLAAVLQSSVQFVGLDGEKASNDSFQIAIKTFANLLAITEVFDRAPLRFSDGDLESNEILSAFKTAMTRADSALSTVAVIEVLENQIMPGCEHDDSNLKFACDYSLLAETLDAFLRRFFLSIKTLDMLECEALENAREVMDTWSRIEGRLLDSGRKHLADAIVCCLERMMQGNGIEEAEMLLSAVVSCFVTAKGSSIPSEREMSVIERAQERSF